MLYNFKNYFSVFNFTKILKNVFLQFILFWVFPQIEVTTDFGESLNNNPNNTEICKAL